MKRVVACVGAVALAVSACSASADVGFVETPAESAAAPVTATPEPTHVPTAAPTPTPFPTPTPTARPIIPTDLLMESIDANFARLDKLGVDYSFEVRDDDAHLVHERNAVQELLPASNQKVVTAFGALELIPAEFRFITEVRLDAVGNVYVVGGGDPTLTRAQVVALAEDVVAGLSVELADGQEVVIGDLVVDASYFPPTRTGPGWPARYVPNDVGPMSALMIDHNQHRGDAAYVADPDAGNARLIAEIFEDAGIVIAGEVRVGALEPGAALVAAHRSRPLPQLVGDVLGRSDNQIADALLRQIGRDHAGEAEIPAGQTVVFAHIAGLGLDLGDPSGDGSGLSRENSLSADQLVTLLLMAQDRPWWPTFSAGLAAAGVKGTLAARLEGDTTVGNVRAKTGTLDDVRALSGILTTVDGEPLIFSFIVNGEKAERAVKNMDRIIVAYASATLPQLVG